MSEAPDLRVAYTLEWPSRLIEIARGLASSGRPAASTDPGVAAFWSLLHTVLCTKIRIESRRVGFIGPEDIEDLASGRALEMMRRLDQGTWDVTNSAPAQVNAFLSTVARNAIVDHHRHAGRWRHTSADEVDRERPAARASLPALEASDSSVLRADFAAGLVACVHKLSVVHQRIWFLRVLLEMSSRQIATHPDVSLSIGNVDVIQQRCRRRIRECVRAQGFEPDDIPVGTFTELWKRLGRSIEGTGKGALK